MTGLIVLGLIAAYVALSVFVVRRAKNRHQRLATAAAAILIPLWDIPFGYISFERHCQADGGITKFSEISSDRSLYFTYYPGRPERLLTAGLEAVEFPGFKGKVKRFVRSSSGQLVESEISNPRSTLRIRLKPSEKLPWNVYRQEQVLEAMSGRVIARARAYSWTGGWILAIGEQAGAIASCNSNDLDRVIDVAISGLAR